MTSNVSNSNTSSGNSQAIDLHGMSVKAAEKYVKEKVKEAREKKVNDLTIVTGMGNHINKNGTRGVLRKLVPTWLNDPSLNEGISDVKQDMGAYEIQFEYDDSYSSSLKKLNAEMAPFIASPLYKEIFAEWEEKAKNGDAESLEVLGSVYVNGIGVPVDIEKGLRFLMQAAETLVQTRVLLGRLFASSNFSIKDYKKAKEWFLKAGENADAYFELGKMYWLGRGVIKNDQLAVDFLCKAADLGDGSAALSVADIFLKGIDSVKRDWPRAAKYHAIAVKAGSVAAKVNLAKQHFFGWGIPNNDKEAFRLFLEAASEKEPVAAYYVGLCQETGRGVEKINRVMAYVWYKKAADYGDLDGAFNIAYGHSTGEFYKRDVGKAIELFTPLAEKHHANSLYYLGFIFLIDPHYENVQRGITCLKEAAQLDQVDAQLLPARLYVEEEDCSLDKDDIQFCLDFALKNKDREAFYLHSLILQKNNKNKPTKESLKQLQKAIDLKYAPAYVLYAKTLTTGCKFFAKNEEEAFKYFMLGAEEGDADASTGLGYCYRDGRGTKRDLEKARESFKRAAQKGDATSRKNLISMLQPKEDAQPYSEELLDWLEIDAEEGEADSQYVLGRLLLQKGVKEDREVLQTGVYWLYRAALNEVLEALEALEMMKEGGQSKAVDIFLRTEFLKRHGTEDYESVSF